MPLLLLVVLLLALPLLLPLALVQRYRYGTATRRARSWVATLNLLLLGLSLVTYAIGAALASLWLPQTLRYAALGLGIGAVLGVIGLVLSRWDRVEHGLLYTPNRWLVLAITLVVSTRIVYGIWRSWHAWLARDAGGSWLAASGAAGSFAAGGIVLGYYAMYWAGLRWRIARHRRMQGHR